MWGMRGCGCRERERRVCFTVIAWQTIRLGWPRTLPGPYTNWVVGVSN